MFTDDDTQWLERRWSETRRQLINLVLAECETVFDRLDECRSGASPDWRPVTEALARRAAARRRTAGAASSYDTVLSLLGDARALWATLEDSAGFILSADAPEAALRTVMGRAASRLRAALNPDEVHAKRVWSQLDRISRSVLGGSGLVEDRCVQTHFKAVADHVAAHHPSDRNLPRTAARVADYFLRYCPDCMARGRAVEESGADPADATHLNADFDEYDASGLPLAEQHHAFLAECLQQLDEAQAQALLSKYGEGSRMSAMDSLGLGRKAFATLLIKIEKTVSDCVTEKARLLGAGPTVAVLRWEKL
ncbi:MAG: hypothetical protein RIA71_02170 [Oceanicaulis sp.]